jgi:serine/threonine-protein kinase RsbW
VATPATDSAAIDRDVVILTVPANPSYLAVLRTATAGFAARLGMTLDEIEDLRIAVDEACAILLPIAATTTPTFNSDVTCQFRVVPHALHIDVSVPVTAAGVLPGPQSFSWQVLTALAGKVTAEHHDGVATIHLIKRR